MTVPFALRIGPCSPERGLVALLRSASQAPLSTITQALTKGALLPICDLFGRDEDENETRVLDLLAELAARQTKFEIYVEGCLESLEVFKNLLTRHHQIAYDVEMETELELGEPSEEAIRWSTGNFEYPKRER
ncbi:hypothetical protein MJ904_16385 [Massilia sp. MB5]|uniref:hypothetical protein n=1 Tax=Massilia sp. MB5 TaxID=2919578 RepID=UPI001F0FB7E3|nr:hypothetical protein [Massilia sp. MB5]UMR28707.1 hypothetical protein MJ904_16385 [Massilia sp. MB5]